LFGVLGVYASVVAFLINPGINPMCKPAQSLGDS